MHRYLSFLFLYCSIAFSGSNILDLTYPFDKNTIYWPTESGFKLSVISFGQTPDHYFYSANKFCTPEHGGTHIDAPIHFAQGGISVDQIPAERLIGPLVVIDVQKKIKTPDYLISVADIHAFEYKYRQIQAGDIVFFHTGWGRYWSNKKKYLGTDQLGDLKNLHFPGLSPEAADYLIKQDIKGIGIDTPSMDAGQSHHFPVHRIILGAGKYGVENVAHLEKSPALGATILIAPMKITGGSGAPSRLFALLPSSMG